MSCPDRFELLLALEEGSPEVEQHLETCAECQAALEDERFLGQALGRLRDPAPPADLMAQVMGRMEQIDLARAQARRQFNLGLGSATALIAAVFALFWRDMLLETGLETLSALSGLVTALNAAGGAVAPYLSAVALPVLLAQALLLVIATLTFHRFTSAVRVRS